MEHWERQKTETLLWERLSRPPRLSESDGGQAAAILRFERLLRLLRLLRFLRFTAYCLLLTVYELTNYGNDPTADDRAINRKRDECQGTFPGDRNPRERSL